MMRLLFAILLVGCSVPRGALPEFDDSDGGVDASRDSSVDANIDAPGIDAPGVDAPGVDAPGVDAPGVDAADDAGFDSGCGAVGARTCTGTTLEECTSTGFMNVRECLRGCAGDICAAYDVRNVDMDRLLHVGTAQLRVSSGETVVLDTTTGEIVLEPDTQLRPPGVGIMNGISYEREAQSGAPALGIFSFDVLSIDAGGTLRARGDDAPVILVGGDAVIAGTIDVSASGRIGGVGGYNGGNNSDGGGGAAGGENGETDGLSLGGGGGGGHSANGGAGGDDGPAGGGQGGMVTDDALGTPLVGGGGGGSGARIFGDDSHGGGGGGAVQVSAGTSLVVSGVVRANGSGGDAGHSSGGGGGAGGSIVLQAPSIDISGIVVANGGGGGGGQPIGGPAESGENGRDDRMRAQGGDGPGGGKNGGDGGSGEDLSGQGAQDGSPAGGGGGAAGRVSLFAEGGAFDISGTLSPDASMDAIP